SSTSTSRLTGRWLTYTSCDGVMVAMMPFCSGSSALDFGRWTFSGFIMAEVVIMKMMRRTRKTSVSGVTLISAMMLRLRDVEVLSAMRSPAGVERLEDAAAADAQRGVDALDARLEVVEADHRDDADREAERGGDEGLREAARHDCEPTRARERDGVEGADDAEHGAEQADERRRRADRAEHPQVRAGALHLLEVALGGDPLQLGHRQAVLLLDQVGVDTARGAGPGLPGQLPPPPPR